MLTRNHHCLLLLSKLRQVRTVIFPSRHNVSHFWGAVLGRSGGEICCPDPLQVSMIDIHMVRCTKPFKMTVPGVRICTSCPESCVDSEHDSVILTVGTEGRMAHGKSSLKHYNRIFHQNVDTPSNCQRQVEGRRSNFSCPSTWPWILNLIIT